MSLIKNACDGKNNRAPAKHRRRRNSKKANSASSLLCGHKEYQSDVVSNATLQDVWDYPSSHESLNSRKARSDPAREGQRKTDGIVQNRRQTAWSEADERKHLKDLHRLRETLKAEGLILLLPEIRKIVRSGDQAICLCQMLYWFSPGEDRKTRARLRKKDRPERWMAKTVEEFAEEVGLTTRQARLALDWLSEKEFIQRIAGGFSGRKKTFWRIAPGKIEEEITQQQIKRKAK